MSKLTRLLRGSRGGGGSGSSGGGGTVTDVLLWSQVFAAAGTGDDIVVGVGTNIVFDVSQTPVYGDITVNGTITVQNTKNTELRFAGMTVSATGVYEAGTEASPFPRTYSHSITPSGPRTNDPFVASPGTATASMNRGLMVSEGGRISWVAAVPDVVIFKLGATAAIGATSITAAVPVTLRAGDQLELGTSMYWQEGMSDLNAIGAPGAARRPGYGQEIVTVASDVTAGTTITLIAPLAYRHHGQLQYLVPPAFADVANTNLSYTYRAIVAGDSFGTVNGNAITGARVLASIAAGAASVIDNRSTVGLLTHPIKFGAPNDSDWTTHGYGAHLMVMGLSSRCQMQGVQRTRVGQAGFLGRYPDHQHMRSYQSYTGGVTSPVSGTFLGDVDPAFNYIKKCSTYLSSNRGSTIHGTCAFNLFQNVYSTIDTHCIFLEDGSERRNTIDGNFVSGVHTIGYGKGMIKAHDVEAPGFLNEQGPSGIWYTSPDNYLRNNIVSGAHTGIWNAFSHACFGLSRNVVFNPFVTLPLQHFNNESGCCKHKCMTTGPFVVEEPGTLGGNAEQYGFNGSYSTDDRALIEKANLWKSGSAWYSNRVHRPNYLNWTTAGLKYANPFVRDYAIGIFGVTNGTSGGGTPAMFDGCSFFTRTLDDFYASDAPQQAVSYNNSVSRKNCIMVPAPMGTMHVTQGLHRSYQNGGTMALWDFYENIVEVGFIRDTNTSILGANPGFYGVQFPPGFLLSQFSAAYMTALGNPTIPSPSSQGISGAKKLPTDGSMFGQDGWWVFDSPYLLYGTTGAVYAQSSPGATNLNGVLLSTAYNYYGLGAERANNVGLGHIPDSAATSFPVNYTRIQSDGVTPVTPGGTWNTGAPDPSYGNMRSACILDGGIVDTSWSRTDVPLPTSLQLRVRGMTPANANFTWSIDWDGATAVTTATLAGNTFAPVASKALLLAATTRSRWVDTANNKLWLRVFGGDIAIWELDARVQDGAIYKEMFISINGG